MDKAVSSFGLTPCGGSSSNLQWSNIPGGGNSSYTHQTGEIINEFSTFSPLIISPKTLQHQISAKPKMLLQFTNPNVLSVDFEQFICQKLCKHVCKLILRSTKLHRNFIIVYQLSNKMIPCINMLTLLHLFLWKTRFLHNVMVHLFSQKI